MTYSTEKLPKLLSPLFSGIYDTCIMLSNVVAFGALKYGAVITPTHLTTVPLAPFDLLSIVSICVDGKEIEPFMFVSLRYPLLEAAMDVDPFYKEDIREDLVHQSLESVGESWHVGEVLIVDMSNRATGKVELPDEMIHLLGKIGIDGSRPTNKVVAEFEKLGFKRKDEITRKENPLWFSFSEQLNMASGGASDVMYFLQVPTREFWIPLDQVLETYTRSKDGRKMHPLVDAR